jgi:hypothetical protein
MITAAGTNAWWTVLEVWAMVRRIIDIVKVVVKPKSRKIKKHEASRRRFAMKYSGMLKTRVDIILDGRSQMVEDTASERGRYKAYLACFSTIGR